MISATTRIQSRMSARFLVLIAVVLASCAPGMAVTPATQAPEPATRNEPASTASPSALRSMGAAATPSEGSGAGTEASPEAAATVTIVAAGDIAGCGWDSDSATAAMVAAHPAATVLTLGDNVYNAGSDERYAHCYGETWGQFLDRTRPTIGNHDVQDDGGDAYYRYFGTRAGPAGQGWYSFDLGDWHIVSLNSNCQQSGCQPGSAQHDWLVADLAASSARCTLAYWHHPRFSSSKHGNHPFVQPIWDALYRDGAEIVLAGHDHTYERFAPQSPTGAADPNGIVEFVAGTGGAEHYRLKELQPNSEVLSIGTWGILELTLSATGYSWAYRTTDGEVADQGTGTCH